MKNKIFFNNDKCINYTINIIFGFIKLTHCQLIMSLHNANKIYFLTTVNVHLKDSGINVLINGQT